MLRNVRFWLLLLLMLAVFFGLLYHSTRKETVYLEEVGYLNVANTTTKTRYLTNKKSLTIYVHGNDIISRNIISNGVWEKEWQEQIATFIRQHQYPCLIDLGCNVGVFTLTAASLGCRVIAVDANPENTKRLQQSVIANGFKDKVTILLNAITNQRKTFVMKNVKDNVGAGQIRVSNKTGRGVQGIFMDDLRTYFDYNSSVIIKMDIERQEAKAMERADKLFKHINVLAVLMEWMWIKEDPNVLKLILFFMDRSYKPFPDFFSKKVLQVSNYFSWPYDIVWRKM